jgi:hypothetical protein
MRRLMVIASVVLLSALGFMLPLTAEPVQSGGVQRIDLAERLKSGKLRAVNREVTPSQAGREGIHLSEAEGNGVAWIEGTDFAQGTIELDIRGRDLMQRSFVGVAFHRTADTTYEAVYLRPFNFRNSDEARRQNAVQYISLPDYDWPRLRKEFPSEFENPVDASVVPTEWVPVRVVVKDKTVQVYVGPGTSPALEVRKLGTGAGGEIGLWAGNGSDGDYANLRITPAK